ncbi:MAG TPA: hypothetical protein VJZ77_15105 [Blastocatellia bacterium]|nr:hypothetical protein [Blastocatellia bacterium]
MSDIFTRDESLSYNGFDIATITKSEPIEFSYAVIKKSGRMVAKFDSPHLHGGPGNAIDIGLFPLLGGNTKQLIISQTLPRTGRHWIVELAANPKVLFDSGDYEVGREEVQAVDLDGDGVYEIGLYVKSFYNEFNQLSMMYTPLPTVFFRYDKRAGRYLPANHRYRDYFLKNIEADMSDLPTAPGEQYLASRLNVLLRFLYTGKEKEGWEFFDKAYTLPDADKIKAIVKENLQNAPAYKFIRKRSSN